MIPKPENKVNRVETSNNHQLIAHFLPVFEALEEFSSIHTSSASSQLESTGATNRLAGETALLQAFDVLLEYLRIIEVLEASRPPTIACQSLRHDLEIQFLLRRRAGRPENLVRVGVVVGPRWDVKTTDSAEGRLEEERAGSE